MTLTRLPVGKRALGGLASISQTTDSAGNTGDIFSFDFASVITIERLYIGLTSFYE